MESEREVILFIRCHEEARRRFKTLVAQFGFKSYEAALDAILTLASAHSDELKAKARVRWG